SPFMPMHVNYLALRRLGLESLLALSSPSSSCQPCALSLHDALPISALAKIRPVHVSIVARAARKGAMQGGGDTHLGGEGYIQRGDRKSTRLNSSHVKNSYADFCLKKKTRRKCL